MSVIGILRKHGINIQANGDMTLSGDVYAQNLYGLSGNVYYVDRTVTSSGSGTRWANAKKTIAEAITVTNARIGWSNSPWANNDIIVIGPGTYAENLTSLPHGCIVIGAGPDLRDAQLGTKIKPASGDAVDVGAVINAAFINICFETTSTSDCFDAAIMNNCTFLNCRFQGPAETSTANGIVTNDAVGNHIINCEFSCLDKGIDVNYADGGDSFSHNWIKDSVFDQIDTAAIEISTNLVGPSSKVTNCFFFGGGATMSYAIDDNSGILDVAGCNAESTSGYDGCRSVNGSYNNGALVT